MTEKAKSRFWRAWLETRFERAAERATEAERRPPEARIWTVTLVGLAVILGASAVRIAVPFWVPEDSISIALVNSLSALVIGLYAGAGVLAALRRRQAYQRGWQEARRVVFASLGEALQRGIPPMEWVALEIERDLHDLGLADDAELQAELARLRGEAD